MSNKCNHDCFNCIYNDCITNVVTKAEREEIKQRDFNYFDSNFVIQKSPKRAKNRYSR